MILRTDHQASGQDPDAAIEDTHMDVQNEAVYIFATEKRLRKGKDCRVVGAQDLPHECQPRYR